MQRKLTLGVLVCAGLAALTSGLAVRAANDREPSATRRPAAAAVVKTAYNGQLKTTIIVDGSGRTLYMWTADIGGKSACTTPDCTKLWPPYRSVGKPVAGKGINPARLDTTPDGNQVRYNRHPLYRFRGGGITGPGDKKPGDVEGQGLFDVWYVLSPRGVPIHTKPA